MTDLPVIPLSEIEKSEGGMSLYFELNERLMDVLIEAPVEWRGRLLHDVGLALESAARLGRSFVPVKAREQTPETFRALEAQIEALRASLISTLHLPLTQEINDRWCALYGALRKKHPDKDEHFIDRAARVLVRGRA